MNRKTLAVLLLLLITSFSLFSQNQAELKASALRDAKITAQATLKMDFETVLKYTLPSVVKIMGGKDKALELLESTFASMGEQGFTFEKADIIEITDFAFEEEEYRCVVKGFNQMKVNNVRVSSDSYLLGLYNETGAFWYFIEAKQLKNSAILDQVLPDFKTHMTIPEDTMQTEEIKD